MLRRPHSVKGKQVPSAQKSTFGSKRERGFDSTIPSIEPYPNPLYSLPLFLSLSLSLSLSFSLTNIKNSAESSKINFKKTFFEKC